MIKLKLPKLKSLRQKFEKLSRKRKIVALVFGGVIVSGMIFVFAELGGYGVNGPATAPNSLDYGLVGYWNMEEGNGQVVKDKSGNGNDGTLGANSSVGPEDPVFASGHDSAGENGMGMKFDGVDDYINIGDKSSLEFPGSSFSTSSWVKPTTVSGYRSVIGKEYEYAVYNNGGSWEFWIWNGASWDIATITGTVKLNEWQHIVTTFDGTVGIFFLNGVEIGRANMTYFSGNNQILTIGSKSSGFPFSGSIDEVRIYNRAISADEVRLLYNQKKPILEMNFDEGSGSVAHDQSFNNFDGALGGGAAGDSPTWVDGKFGSALRFDGSNDFVSASASSLPAKNVTVEMFVKISGAGMGTFAKVGDANGYGVGLGSTSFGDTGTRLLGLYEGVRWIDSGYNFPAPGWYHVALEINDTGAPYFFVNGILVGSAAAGLPIAPLNIVTVGGYTTATRCFAGDIDEFRVYNYLRSASELLADYNGGMAAHLGSDSSMGYYGDKNNYAWKYRKMITINHTKVSPTDHTDQTNFPMLVSFTDPLLKTVANGGRVTNANGYDIIFTDTSGTQKFDYEIEKYVPTTGEIVMWVKIPVLSASIDTSIYIYYGNSTISVTQENKTGVWDDGSANNFKGVYHLRELGSGAAGDYKDSTQYANNSTNATNQPDATTGHMAGAEIFNGTSDQIIVSGSQTVTSATFSTWIYRTATPSDSFAGIFFSRGSDVSGLNLHDTTNNLGYHWNGGTNSTYDFDSGLNLPLNTWVYAVVTVSPTAATFYLGNAGTISTATNSVSHAVSTINALKIGCDNTRYFPGSIDEARFSDVVRSAGWIATEYNNQNSPSAFYSLGNEQMNLSPILQYKFDEGSGAIAYNAGFGDYLSSWQYRKSIVVTNQVASALSGYQVNLTLDTAALYSAGKMKIDGSDLRFADVNGVDIPYWIESGINTSSTIIWIKTDLVSSEAKTVYMYYGNSTASAGSNGKNIFDIFDDFSGAAVDANIWNVVTYNGASVAVSGGNLRLQGVDGSVYLTSKTNISANSIVRCNFKSVTLNGSDSSFRVGASTSGEMAYKGSSGARMFVNEGVSWGPSLESLALNNYYIYEVRQNGTTLYGRRASSTWDTYTVGNPASYNVFMYAGYTGYVDSYVDWVAVRQYAATEPSSGAWSAEEKTPNSDLALVNSPTWVTGKFGTALNFTAASSQYSYTPDNASISLTGDLTMAAWIKPTSVTVSTLFDIGGKWDGANESYLLSQYGNQIRVYVDSSSSYKTTTAANLSAGIWYHVEAVYVAASQTVDIYINGILQAGTVTGTIPTSIGDDAGRFQIGAEDTTTTPANFYDGLIDNFNLYGYAHTEHEVLTDFNDGLAAHLGKNNQDLNSGLVGYWDMEEGIGQTIKDKSGNGNDGTLGASTASETDDPVFSAGHDASGLVGAGLLGDGGTDYVDVGTGTNLALTNLGAISLWIKPNSLAQDSFANFVTRRANATGGTPATYSYTFHWRGSDSTIRMAISDGVTIIFTSIPILTDTNWHHLVGMWDGSFLTIYKDGILASTPTAQTVNSQAGAALSTTLLGNCFSTSASNRGEFNGTIDEVRMYNRALSEDEIHTLYNQKKPVLEMKFDEGSGTVAHDGSFNNNDGTLGGDGLGTDLPAWATGKFGTALNFDGSDDYVYLNSAVVPSAIGTINFWIKPTWNTMGAAPVNARGVIYTSDSSNYADKTLQVYLSDGYIRFNVAGYGNVSLFIGNIQDTWTHFSFAYSSNSVSIYKNGNFGISDSFSGPLNVPKFQLGRIDYSGTWKYFSGNIDEVRVYSYARTADEVLTDYNSGLAAHLR